VFLRADFQEDGDVDAADLTAWRAGFGTSSGATHAQGDANGDGRVDGGDFLHWQRQVGSVSAAFADSIAVPETGSIWIAAVGLLIRRRTASRC
jgi:hypothetical protein